MSKNKIKSKQLEDSDDSDSGPEDRTPPPKKPKTSSSASTTSKGKSGDGEDSMFQIGKMRYASVREFRGKVMVDIREYYHAADGDMKPGKRGIALSVEQWNALVEQTDDINDAVKKMA
ncbi:Transcriptional coactivator [Chamberlinius hualienensis]